MTKYDWPTLLKLWEQERLSAEQVIGQLLQWGQQSQRAEDELRRHLAALERRVTILEALGSKPATA